MGFGAFSPHSHIIWGGNYLFSLELINNSSGNSEIEEVFAEGTENPCRIPGKGQDKGGGKVKYLWPKSL